MISNNCNNFSVDKKNGTHHITRSGNAANCLENIYWTKKERYIEFSLKLRTFH